MTSTGGRSAAAVLWYTVLRLALFAAVWLTIELLTPVSGLAAIVIAILVSGAVSLVLLDRARNRVGAVAEGFFGGINARIEASARAEDVDEPPDSRSGQPEDQPEGKPVDQQ